MSEKINELTEQAKQFTSTQAQNAFSRFINSLKKTFSFQGRASRAEFWTFLIGIILIDFIFGIAMLILGQVFVEFICNVLVGVICLINIFLVIGYISVSVRRLHDLDLSGFWMWYLAPLGLPVVFMVNLLDLDESCNTAMERISKTCTNWISWIFLPFFWFLGAPTAMLLLFLYKGKDHENRFGSSPLA